METKEKVKQVLRGGVPCKVKIYQYGKPAVFEVNPTAPEEYIPKDCPLTLNQIRIACFTGSVFLKEPEQLWRVEVLKTHLDCVQGAWGDTNHYVEKIDNKLVYSENYTSIGD